MRSLSIILVSTVLTISALYVPQPLLPVLAAQGLPLLVGLSRKSLIGKLLGRDVDQRLPASLALAVLAAERGASLIRTHDVAETADAVAMFTAMKELGE